MKKLRLDKLLVDRKLVASRERARAMILAGQVEVGGIVVDKAGAQVAADASVTLRQAEHGYVSRGALKLEPALDEFAVDPSGMVALDIGASTGGFTDLLLRRGAARVYAIDVGYGQLAWSLRQDPRVIVLERENVRYLDPTKVPEPCQLAVIDVSFISLTLILDKVAQLLGPPPGKAILCLVKPQFEVGKERVGKGGVVRDPADRAFALDKVRDFAAKRGFEIGPVIDSPIAGPAGNLEMVLLLHTTMANYETRP